MYAVMLVTAVLVGWTSVEWWLGHELPSAVQWTMAALLAMFLNIVLDGGIGEVIAVLVWSLLFTLPIIVVLRLHERPEKETDDRA